MINLDETNDFKKIKMSIFGFVFSVSQIIQTKFKKCRAKTIFLLSFLRFLLRKTVKSFLLVLLASLSKFANFPSYDLNINAFKAQHFVTNFLKTFSGAKKTQNTSFTKQSKTH